MNLYQSELSRLKQGIAAALPGIKVNESLIEHEFLRREELMAGVVTVLLEQIKPEDDWLSIFQLMITGQVEVEPESNTDDTGAKVEAAEIALFYRLRAYLRNTGDLPRVVVEDVQFSTQSKRPFGWFLIRARFGPINDACGGDDAYPPQMRITDLNRVNVNIDTDPHETGAEHKKWLEGDYSTSQPEATAQVEFKP